MTQKEKRHIEDLRRVLFNITQFLSWIMQDLSVGDNREAKELITAANIVLRETKDYFTCT